MGKRGGIKFTWLHSRYGGEADNDPDRIRIHTQAYMLLVVGSVLFPTASRNVVHPKYITPLFYLERIHTIFLGFSCFGVLISGFGACCKEGGCSYMRVVLMLLMIWSYERFDIGLPTPLVGQDNYPVAEYWAYSKGKGKGDGQLGKRRHTTKGPHHILNHYRAEFDGVCSDIVEWMLYAHSEA